MLVELTGKNCSLTTANTGGSVSIASNIALSVVMGLIAIASVFSNSVVIASVVKTPRLQKPANLMLCSLSLSDLLTGLTVMPLSVATRLLLIHVSVSKCVYQRVLITYIFFLFTCSSTSFVQLCLLSWDRYKAVSNPLVYRSKASNRKTLKTIVVTWLACTTGNTLMLAMIPRPLRDYIIFVNGAVFVAFPAAMQVATYKAIRRHNRDMVGTESQAAAATALAREKKVLTTLRYVLAALLFSIAVPLVVHSREMVSGVEHIEKGMTAWANIFVFMNSCVNPTIYFLRHPDMRTAAFRLIGH